MSAEELREWEAYDEIEPIGHDWRSDYRTALTCSTLVNVAKRVAGGKGEPTSYKDFLIYWDPYDPNHPDREQKTQSVDQMRFILRGIVKQRGGQVQQRDPEKHEQLKKELGIQ